jgi:hypothetical protein
MLWQTALKLGLFYITNLIISRRCEECADSISQEHAGLAEMGQGEYTMFE